ncbi:MAG: transposase [Proteobacteria bacterium]|nr:transposase [Pseudomonadota bacterium]MBU1569665.1 transposase [Pseudomonadota bacterium]
MEIIITCNEGHEKSDHIYLLLSIPPKYSVSNTAGFIKGKSAIRIHREVLNTKRMTGLSFWSTSGAFPKTMPPSRRLHQTTSYGRGR